jgi:hypothetical protein
MEAESFLEKTNKMTVALEQLMAWIWSTKDSEEITESDIPL